MKIYTSYFANMKEIHSQGLISIAIVAFEPKFYTGLSYKLLAPKPEFLKMEQNQYKQSFAEMLNLINPDQALKDLYSIGGGNDIALVCYESPEKFCHRHLVAKWLMDKTGLTIEELPTKKEIAVKDSGYVQTSLF